ncbi:TetR/AcrR family transcriptional regulator [Actinomadura parmotrematis]|uniref:TetR/AcrR family transcriptional regulator helix-turn-helix transcriptional regulator n=1 Tax=Actinomadura parmotrematis TaxID=2864039 RepID=A0ABS7G403_9ACTN|nr:TetR/AcrR family transcriptional regulator [Actinomadura parmotrematis]MBW8486579.1 TetR/AcrR family transcriptional regulator; helix-turn-helix transcriptional regulator [Actinomadura parmotrematis]
MGAPDAKNRALLLDAAEALMLEEGYAAVTSRRVAARAGLKPQLVHYYFRTMDDLFLAAFRRRAEEGVERQAEALASPQPLRALWEFSTDPSIGALTMEYSALANHRKVMRDEIARYAERLQAMQNEAFERLAGRYGIDLEEFPAAFLGVLMTSLSRMTALEKNLGVTLGHAETTAVVERYLSRFESNP